MPETSDQRLESDITKAIMRLLAESAVATLATLVAAPQGTGAKLLVEETGALTGSLNHSTLDEAVARYAPTFLASRAEAATFNFAELTRDIPQPAHEIEQLLDARILFERIEPEPRLVICGAGHVGASLARLARLINYRTTLIDDRAQFVARALFPDEGIELIAAESWTDALGEVIGKGRGVSVAVVTRGHNEDEECLRAVVAAQPDYIGLIGSRRRTNIVLSHLREEGVNETLLKKVRAPIGLDIGAVSPEEVALAILAEIVAERRGGAYEPLSSWRRK